MIHLDNNATTRPTPEVVRAVCSALEEDWHNPSSVHRAGQNAKHRVEIARSQLASLIGARPRELTFTGSGTEAIDLAIRGTLGVSPRRGVVTTPVEHHAVRALCERLGGAGTPVGVCPVDADGLVDPGVLSSMIGDDTAIVSVQWVNNETGVIQPIEEIARVCNERGVVLHCDATQAVGKIPVDLGGPSMPRFDLLTFSPHKFHGPKGVGVLRTARTTRLLPTIVGTQELGRRGGTEPVPAIVGAGAAGEQAMAWLGDHDARGRVAVLRDRLERGILARCAGAVVNGGGARRVENTTNIGFPRLEAEGLLLLLSERGVCVSAGSACASGSLEPSPVILAMGVDPKIAHGSVRFSLSRFTSEPEIDEAIEIVSSGVERLSASLPGR